MNIRGFQLLTGLVVINLFKLCTSLLDSTSVLYGGRPATDSKSTHSKKVVINEGEYGYNVQIFKRDLLICGGALISKEYVLTAAHCFENVRLSNIKIRVGTYKKVNRNLRGVQVSDVQKVIAYPGYNLTNEEDTQPNDIAVVVLKNRFHLTKFVRTIPIATKSERDKYLENEVRIMGFGRKEGNRFSERLQMADVTPVDKYTCGLIIGDLASNAICVASENVAIAGGDSGSPMVGISNKKRKHILLGIASFGRDDQNEANVDTRFPSVYTDVAEFESWIKCIVPCTKAGCGCFGR